MIHSLVKFCWENVARFSIHRKYFFLFPIRFIDRITLLLIQGRNTADTAKKWKNQLNTYHFSIESLLCNPF